MERKLKPIYVQQSLAEKRLRLFSPGEFRRVLGVSERSAQEFIKDHTQDLFIKLRNGLYALRIDPPAESVIANRLYAPSYLSFEYVLSRHGIIPESVYTVTSATTRITREFVAGNITYAYSRIKTQAYRGYRAEQAGDTTILIADPEKALADYLYFVDLKLKPLNDRLDTRKIKKKQAVAYAGLFGRKTLLKLIKEIL